LIIGKITFEMKSGSLETKINHFSNFYGNKVKKKIIFYKQNAILPTNLHRRGKILKKVKNVLEI
jgi:hypothetical protein